jgi:hypothetical protein
MHDGLADLILAQGVEIDFVDGAPGRDHEEGGSGMRIEA